MPWGVSHSSEIECVVAELFGGCAECDSACLHGKAELQICVLPMHLFSTLAVN